MSKIGRERGWPPVTRQQFDAARTLRGSDFVGSPEEIVEKILFQHQLFGHQRLLLQLGLGAISHKRMMKAIELLGTQIAPAVRAEIQRRRRQPLVKAILRPIEGQKTKTKGVEVLVLVLRHSSEGRQSYLASRP